MPIISSQLPEGGQTTSSRHKKILITEDSPVTQDILKLVLSAKGHDVHVANDGKIALTRLLEEPFDLALMDYHLPEMSGAEVVARVLAERAPERRPVFVAMTADVASMEADGDVKAGFAHIFEKPFDFDELLDFLETMDAQKARDGGATLARRKTSDAPTNRTQPDEEDPDAPQIDRIVPIKGRPAGYEQYRPLFWPQDMGPAGFSVDARKFMASGGDYDVVVVTEPASADHLRALWSMGDLHLLPIIDETGQLAHQADICLPKIPRGSVERIVGACVEEFTEARTSVHLEVRQSDELSDKLLASLYVRGRKLTPEFSGATPQGFTYNIALAEEEIDGLTAHLTSEGLLKRSFVDRLHACPNCASVRLNVREECFECRSPDLEETAIVHHFKCAYQGPLRDFQQGSDLVCPKCARELRHFGVDYDKPGTVISCRHCGATSSDAVVGFKCLDCATHTDGEAIRTHNVYAFELTEKGRALAEEGFIVTGAAQRNLKFGELPLDLVIALNKSARLFSEEARPFCLVTAGYPQRRMQLAEHGPRLVELSRRQSIENLRNYFGDAATIHQGTDFDYILLDRMTPESFHANTHAYEEIAQSGLKIDLETRFSIFGPNDLFG
ncbi:response regulator [Breoghania sp.]|uniref:TackOD1 domain-containing metal-binding protein n=1 Tax=Breoghania sp. TaxID=2065378 RepID=UPI002AAA6583|nr:response regulator [Breoghania sp.]